MQFPIDLLTVDSPKVLFRLRTFLTNMKAYPSFDENMPLNVFVNSAGDFTAFEAVNLPIQFTSTDHKLIETITSKYIAVRTDYQQFAAKVFAL